MRLLACLLVLVAVTGCGSESTVPPDPIKLGTVEYDITYGEAGGVALRMDVYYPQFADRTVPAVLYVHGGAWISGDKASGTGVMIIPELVARGYLVAAINYRLAPEHKFPAQIEDVKCAVRYLRANATTYGIDANRIGAFGGSAGGHLVALLGTSDRRAGFEGSCGYDDQSSRVQTVVDLFGPADLTVLFKGAGITVLRQVFGTTDSASEIVSKASPISHATGDDPPFLILHGDEDALVPLSQSEMLYDALATAGVPATLVVVKNGGHGFMAVGGRMTPDWREIIYTIADFFDKHLK